MRVSIVVVAYNMERELPRTLRSLSPQMQLGIDDIEYEIVVVDNGSDTPVDLGADASWVRLIRIDDASPSPVEAINHGIDIASGDLVGVMIDGARLASPGMPA